MTEPSEPLPQTVQLVPRVFTETEKVNRTFYVTDTVGDDFIRNRLTAAVERTVWSEHVETVPIEGTLSYPTRDVAGRPTVLAAGGTALLLACLAFLLGANDIGYWLCGAAFGCFLSSLALRPRERTVTVGIEADRTTWAAYPDAPITEREELGEHVRHVQYQPHGFRFPKEETR